MGWRLSRGAPKAHLSKSLAYDAWASAEPLSLIGIEPQRLPKRGSRDDPCHQPNGQRADDHQRRKDYQEQTGNHDLGRQQLLKVLERAAGGGTRLIRRPGKDERLYHRPGEDRAKRCPQNDSRCVHNTLLPRQHTGELAWRSA